MQLLGSQGGTGIEKVAWRIISFFLGGGREAENQGTPFLGGS